MAISSIHIHSAPPKGCSHTTQDRQPHTRKQFRGVHVPARYARNANSEITAKAGSHPRVVSWRLRPAMASGKGYTLTRKSTLIRDKRWTTLSLAAIRKERTIRGRMSAKPWYRRSERSSDAIATDVAAPERCAA